MKKQLSPMLVLKYLVFLVMIQLSTGRQFESVGVDGNNRINITSITSKSFQLTAPYDLDLLLLEIESLAEFTTAPKMFISTNQDELDSQNAMVCSFEYSYTCALNPWGTLHANQTIFFAIDIKNNNENNLPSLQQQSTLFGKIISRPSIETYLEQQFIADSRKEIVVSLINERRDIKLDIQKQGISQVQVTLLKTDGSLYLDDNYEINLHLGSQDIQKGIITQGYILDKSIWFTEFNSTMIIKSNSNQDQEGQNDGQSYLQVQLSPKNTENVGLSKIIAVITYKYVDEGEGNQMKGLIETQLGEQQVLAFSQNYGIVLKHPLLQMNSLLTPLVVSFNLKGIDPKLLVTHQLIVNVYSSILRFRQNKVENTIINTVSFNLTLTQQVYSVIILAFDIKKLDSEGQQSQNETEQDNQAMQQLALLQTKIGFGVQNADNQIQNNNKNNTTNLDDNKQKKSSYSIGEDALLPIILVGGIVVIIIFTIIYIKCIQGRNSVNEPAELEEENEEEHNHDQNQQEQLQNQQQKQDVETGKVVLKKPISTKNSTKTNGHHIELAQDDKSAIEIIENQDTTDRKSRARNKNNKPKTNVNKDNPLTQNDATAPSNDNSHMNLKSNDNTALLEQHPHGKRIPMRAKNMKSHLRIVIEDSSFDNVKQQSQQQLQQLQLQQQRQFQLKQQQQAIQKQMQMKALRQKQLQASESSQETN